MKTFKDEQSISQLEKRKGGYFYLKIPAEVVNQFKNGRKARLICKIDNKHTLQCGLNHFGDGNFFIILGSKFLKEINKQLGDKIKFELAEDPDPLGVAMPEVLEAVLAQDEELNNLFNSFTLGKKRSLIFAINKIKDPDKQIAGVKKYMGLLSKPRK